MGNSFHESIKNRIAFIVLLFLPFLTLSQLPGNTADSLRLQLKGATNDTVRFINSFLLARCYRENDWDRSLRYADSAIIFAKRGGQQLDEALALNEKGYALTKIGNYSGSLEAFLEAKRIAEDPASEKNSRKWDYPTVRSYRLNTLILILHESGHLYRRTGNLETAVKCYQEAKMMAESFPGSEPEFPAIITMNLGYAYYSMDRLDTALFYEQASIKYFHALPFKHKYEYYPWLRSAMICQKMGRYDDSHDYLGKAIQLSLARNNTNGLGESYQVLSDLFRQTGQFDSCIIYARKGIVLNRQVMQYMLIADAYKVMSVAYQSKGRTDSALFYANAASGLSDSLNNVKIKNLGAFQDAGFREKLRVEELEKEKIRFQSRVRTYGFLGGVVLLSLVIFIFYRSNRQRKKANKALEEKNILISKEKKYSDELLLNILPSEVVEEIRREGRSKARTFSMVTVLFTDFKDFTAVSEKYSAELLVAEIDCCFSAFDNIIQKCRVEKIKTIGDSYMCVGGMPVLTTTHAVDVVNAAIEIRNFMLERKKERDAMGGFSFELRLGIHTGPVVAGIVGVKKYAYDIWGDTVNLAARMEQNSEAGKINISGSTYKLVKDKFNCIYRGKIEAKNKGEVEMYFVEI